MNEAGIVLDSSWVTMALGATVGALVSAVTFLYRTNTTNQRDAAARIDSAHSTLVAQLRKQIEDERTTYASQLEIERSWTREWKQLAISGTLNAAALAQATQTVANKVPG